MPGIFEQTSQISSTQPDAVSNITGANVLGITPDIFKDNKDGLQPVLSPLALPTDATPIVAQNIAQSPEHAAAIAPDADHMSFMEREYKAVARSIGKGLNDPDQERRDLLYKKMSNNGELDQDSEFRLAALNQDAASSVEPDFGLKGPIQKALPFLAGAASGLVGMVNRNRDLFGGIVAAETGAYAAGGAVAGLPEGGVGAIPGALIGAGYGLRAGLAHAFIATTVYDSYKQAAAEGYGQLQDLKDANGQSINLDEGSKANIARGLGVISGALNGVAGAVTIENVPFVNSLFGKNLGPILKGNPALGKALAQLGTTASTMGGAAAMQTFASQVGNELAALKGQTGEYSLTNALINADKNFASNKGGAATQVGTSFVEGAAGGVALHAVGSVAAHVAGKFAAPVGDAIRGHVEDKLTPRTERDITPQEPAQLNTGQSAGPHEIVIPPEEPPPSDIHPETTAPPIKQVSDVLKFQDAVDAASAVAKESNLHKLAPEQVSELRRQMMEDNGMTKAYIDKEDGNAFINAGKDENEKALRDQKLKAILDPKGLAAASNNAPASIDMHKGLDLVDEFEDFSKFMKLTPEGPSANSAKVWLDREQAAQDQRVEIRNKLGAGEKSPEERAYAVKVSPEVDDKTLASSIATKEVATAYLDRLDVNEVAVKEDTSLAPEEKTQKLQNISTMRERVQPLVESLPDDKTSKETLTQALQTPTSTNEVWNEHDFLNQPGITEAIKSVSPDAEAKRIDGAGYKARKNLADVTNESAKLEMNSLRDVYYEMAQEAVRQQELSKIENDPNVAVVEKWIAPTAEANGERDFGHAKKGYPIYAIDPSKLSDLQKKRYLKDPRLKSRKTFVKGGVTPDESARMLGVNTGENLLRILKDTQTKAEYVAERTKLREAEIAKMADDSVDLDHTAISHAYHELTENHLEVMKYLKDKEWPVTKTAIKRIALDVPRRAELTAQAESAVSQMKLSDLNPNQFKVGERKSNRIAIKALTDGDLLTAFVNKRAAALNSEMAIASMKAIAEGNRLIKLGKIFKNPETKKLLGKAGPSFLKAANEILDVFRLDPSLKDQSIRGSYQKWVKKQIKEGNGNFSINPRLADVRQSLNDLTVEESKLIRSRLSTILHSAKIEHALVIDRGDQNLQSIADELHASFITHPDYDIKRTVKGPTTKNLSIGYKIQALLTTEGPIAKFNAFATNIDHILVDLDKDVVGGKLADIIGGPLNGTGKYSDMGLNAEARDHEKLSQFYDKVVSKIDEIHGDKGIKNKFGLGEWNSLRSTQVYIPEFKNVPELSNGYVTKANLLMLMLNGTNEGNRVERERSFGISNDVIDKVLDRELEPQYADIVQMTNDHYQNEFFERVAKLEFEMTGDVPKMVQPRPWTHRGIERPGGYYGLHYDSEMSYESLRRKNLQAKDALSGEKRLNFLDSTYTASDMTLHGHTEAREGSGGKKLSLELNTYGMGFEARIRDLNFRKPLRDALQILDHETVAHDITAIKGVHYYNALLANIVSLARSTRLETSALYNSDQHLSKALNSISNAQAAGLLLFKPKVVAMQATSAVWLFKELGPMGLKHSSEIIARAVANPHLFGMMSDFAAEILPSLYNEKQGIGVNQRDIFLEKIGSNIHKGLKPFEAMNDAVQNVGWAALSIVDSVQKILAINTAYKQYLAGDAPGHALKDIMKMTPEERDHQAKIFATSVARLNLTTGSDYDKALVQRHEWAKHFTPFWTDGRNAHNNVLRIGRKVRQSTQESFNNFKDGEFKKGASASFRAATISFAGIAVMATLNYLQDLRYGFDTPNLSDSINNPKQVAKDVLSFSVQSILHYPLGEAPFLRSVEFMYQQRSDWGSKEKVVSFPVLQPLNNAVETLLIAREFMDGYDLSEKDAKVLAWDMSYLMQNGLAINGAFGAYDAIKDLNPGNAHLPAMVTDVDKRIEKFLKEHEETTADASENKLPQEVIDELNKVRVQTSPPKDNAVNESDKIDK